jgi:type IV secretory pathway TraG/TraD family ATPase VirD4
MKLPALVRDALRPSPRPAPPPAPGGLYLGWGTNGPVRARTDEHALVIGPPRSGKTSRLLVFAVLAHTGPAVVTSTKPDVLALTAPARARLGRVWLWDPSGTTPVPDGVEELRWSPVVGCEIWDEAVARAYALSSAARPHQSAHDAHWVERAQALLAPLLHAAALAGADLAVVLSWLHRRELVMPLSTLTDKGAHRAAALLAGIGHTDPRELSGIFSTADSLLAGYRTDAALGAARFPNFAPSAFAASTDTIYICAPSITQALHAPLVISLLDQVRSAVYHRRRWPAMLFALDEVAQIAPLPDLASTIAEGGSQALVVMACLQDLSQARARWGVAADGFLTLFTHKLVLPGIADLTTLKAVSALAGEVDVRVRSTTVSNGGFSKKHASTTRSSRRQPRLPVDTVARGTPGTALLISGTGMRQVWLPPLANRRHVLLSNDQTGYGQC